MLRLAEFLRKLNRTPLKASGRSLFARGIAGLLLPALLLSGCGKQPAPEEPARLTSADIPLLEPVAASVGTERAAYRNLYDYELLTGTVYPETEEYAFTENVTFDSFAVLPGEEVAPGTLLVNADTKQLKDQMKGVQDQIDNLTLGYEQYMELSNLQLEEYQSYIDYREEWRKVDEKVAQDVQRQIFRKERLQTQMENRTKLYELDLAYYRSSLNDLRKKLALRSIKCDIGGTVSAVADLKQGDNVRENNAVIAVSNNDRKFFNCAYRSEKVIAKISRMYLVAGGKSYEVSYQPYTAEEYNRLTASGEDVPSVFEILGDVSELPAGTFGTLVLIREERHGALSVSDSAIHKDGSGYFVNRVTDRGTEKVYIERGMREGNFTEILSGLEYGDKILLSDYLVETTESGILERGDFKVPYTGTGYVYFPGETSIKNDVAYGEVTMTELLVEVNDIVKKGDPIASVSVKGDTIALEELERKLQRLEERRARYQEKVEDPANEYLSDLEKQRMQDQLASYDSQIESAKESVDELKSALRTTAIKAPMDGVILSVTDLSNGAVLESGELIATMTGTEDCFVRVPNARDFLQYGMEMEISYGKGENKVSYRGEIVNLTSGGISAPLRNENVWMREETGTIRKLALEGDGTNDPAYYMIMVYGIDGYTEYEEDVVLVPLKAVTKLNNKYYVQVRNADGNTYMQGFIPGTNQTEMGTPGGDVLRMMWALEGLEEGTEICWG